MQRLIAITVGIVFSVAALPVAQAQEASDNGVRKIVVRKSPVYPELARRMRLEGTVKLQVTVAANGSVKSVEAIGGSPVLVKAAEDSIYGFKWTPANRESRELVEIKFQPE